MIYLFFVNIKDGYIKCEIRKSYSGVLIHDIYIKYNNELMTRRSLYSTLFNNHYYYSSNTEKIYEVCARYN